MDRATSERMTSRTTTESGEITGNGCLETPPEVFDALHAEFHFDIDLTGGPGTQHRLPLWFGPGSSLGKEDALTAQWYFLPTVYQQRAGGILSYTTICGFSNPIYGTFVPLILEKALKEAQNGFTSVFLLANRINAWYKAMMRFATEIRIVDERITFWEDGHPKWNARKLRETGEKVPDPAMFDSCVVVIRPPSPARLRGRPAQFDLWHWEKERNERCRLIR